MPHSTTGKKSRPDKPSEDFPLFAHQSGQWCKKIKGKAFYFGSWREDPTGVAANERYTWESPYLIKGETPPPIDVAGGCTIERLCNEFMDSKAAAVEDGDLSSRTLADYHAIVKRIAGHFGKGRVVPNLTPPDFREFRSALAKRLNTASLNSVITKIRVVFNYGHVAKLYPEAIDFGGEFKRPSAKRQRRARNQRGPKLFHREEIRRMMAEAPIHLRAMIHLAANGGFGNSDVGTLPISAVDLERAWLTYPRPKTEIPRLVPLWPETVQALRDSLEKRPSPQGRDNAGLVFLTKHGVPYVRVNPPTEDENGKEKPGTAFDAVSMEFGKLVRKLGINARGLNFYTLRHCFETHAGESRDQVAVDAIMGHVDPSMAANYRHSISDGRLRAVVDTVRAWLFPEGEQ